MLNGDMDGTNNTSETINRGLKKFSSCGAKNLKSVFRTIYNFKFDCNKRIANKFKMHKRKLQYLSNIPKFWKFFLNLKKCLMMNTV